MGTADGHGGINSSKGLASVDGRDCHARDCAPPSPVSAKCCALAPLSLVCNVDRSLAQFILQVKLSEYNNLKSQLSTVSRKAAGSIAVRDVSTMVKPQQVIDSENMMTLFVVVSKFALREWEQSYEKLSNFVVSATGQNRAPALMEARPAPKAWPMCLSHDM